MTTTDPEASTAATVRTLITAAGLAPDAGEMAILVAAYPALQEGTQSMYAIPELRYGLPGLIFDADPTFVDWS